MRLAIDHVIGLNTTPEDILAEWEDPELEKKNNEVRDAVMRQRNERKSEQEADCPGSEHRA